MVDGKTILITGAAGRIGSCLARHLIALGGSVVLIDSDEDKLQSICCELKEGQSAYFCIDASDAVAVDKCFEESVSRFGKVDCSIHSAYPRSKGWGTPFESLTKSYLYQDISDQLGGAILFAQRSLSFFQKQGYGNLINISSIQGICAPKFEQYAGTEMVSPLEYSAIKAAIISITKYLAKYHKGQNIRVNCISPGGIVDGQHISFISNYRKACVNKGMLEPNDIVGALLFLISDHSLYINGQNLVIDDGWSL